MTTKTIEEIEKQYAEVFDFLTEQIYLSSKKLPASIRAGYVNTTLELITNVIKVRIDKMAVKEK